MMKKQALNPYLPFWETVPDGEPHVFDGRVYIFGSHDRLNGDNFCLDDYVCWSAPVDDSGNWRCEGVIYRKEQDPINGAPYGKPLPECDSAFDNGRAHLLYAPDVTQGPDGRYYLYYSLDFSNIISVTVCDTPAGQYEFLDYVTRADGSRPSIRHYGGWYYLAYSSLHGHELCYAMSKTPDGPFTYKGILHSNGDLGLNGSTLPTNYTGNNHGGLVKIGEDYYIFGHRHTHGAAYSRQGVTEKITMDSDGTFRQAEMTSCGLNGRPLAAEGVYSAHICLSPYRPRPVKSGAGRHVRPRWRHADPGRASLPSDSPSGARELSPWYPVRKVRFSPKGPSRPRAGRKFSSTQRT